MKPRESFVVILISFLFSLHGFKIFVPPVCALELTESAEKFIIENDYFIAHIPRQSTTNSAGTVKEFYIKPRTDVNIVSHTGGFTSLSGMECGCMNGTSEWGYGTWGVYSGLSEFSVTKMYESSYAVTIESKMVWRTALASSRPNATLVIYHTFYEEPYYLVTMTRIQEDDYAQLYNSQICFLFDNDDYWDKDEANSWYCMDRDTGNAEQDGADEIYLHEASVYGKFPWFWVYNSSQGMGFGTILLDAYPRPMETYIGFVAGGTSGLYSEYQIDLTMRAERQNEPTSVTFLNYARNTTDYSSIESLATDLYQTRKSAITSDEANFPVAFNYKHTGQTTYNVFGRPMISNHLRPVTDYSWGVKGFDLVQTWHSNMFKLKNSTSTYNIFDWSDTAVSGFQNKTYAKAIWNKVFESKLNVTSQFEVWDDSDTMKWTFLLETLATLNIWDAYFYWNSGSSKVLWKTFAGEPDYIKLNSTDYKGFLPATIREEAYLVKNVTNNVRNKTSILECHWHWVDNSGDVQYTSGEEWNITLYVQKFKRYIAWTTDYVDPSDFHEHLEHHSEQESQNYQNWLPLPLFDQEGNLSINRIGTTKSQIVYSEFSDDILTLVFAGETGTTTTRQIYCGDKGKPECVTGADLWNYNSSTKIVTLTRKHSDPISPADVTLEWAKSVGGVVVLIDKFTLLAPIIALAVGIVTLTIVTAYTLKRWYNKSVVQRPLNTNNNVNLARY